MRLDVYLVEGGYVSGRARAKALIEEGCVTLDGSVVTKPSAAVAEGEHTVAVRDPLIYVSRGGQKLEAALAAFGIDPSGLRALDIGASTGGFTDCLLQRGAKEVYAVDAGQGQLSPKIANDARVRAFERINARDLCPEQLQASEFDLIVMDVSFISATYILPRFPRLLQARGEAVVLIKPQFEVGKAHLGKGGIVRDRGAHRMAIERVCEAADAAGLSPVALIPSPIAGGDGNREFLVHLKQGLPQGQAPILSSLIDRVL